MPETKDSPVAIKLISKGGGIPAEIKKLVKL
jgi:hypothetical protein